MSKLRLSTLTGDRYRIGFDEAWYHERPEVRNPDRIWYERILCQSEAFIGIYSLDPLILHLFTSRVKNARSIWKSIKDIPEARADFHFDGEAELFFPLEAVHFVAEMAGARKKRKLSEAHKKKLAEASLVYRFKPKFDASKAPKNGSNLNNFGERRKKAA